MPTADIQEETAVTAEAVSHPRKTDKVSAIQKSQRHPLRVHHWAEAVGSAQGPGQRGDCEQGQEPQVPGASTTPF